MSTAQTVTVESTSLEATLDFARRIGHNLKGGEVIELISDLGAGKTSFVRGLAEGMGCTDHVHSPSFTISNVYKTTGDLELHHFDFYRLKEPGIIEAELAEILGDSQTVIVIEWADIVESILPPDRLSIRINPTGETTRRFTVTCPSSKQYLLNT